jgi:glycosyltransferase involved in cell wall biosynthesis
MQALVDAAVPRHDAAVALQLGAALYLARHTGLPRVFDEAEAGVLRDDYHSRSPGLRRVRRSLTWWKFTHFLRHLTRNFERTTVVSEVELEHLRQMKCDSSAIRVVPNGVERDALGQRNTARPGRLIYPGAITYSANLDAVRYFVNDIFPLVRASRGDASFIVTGATGDIDLGSFTDRGPVAFTGRVNDVSHLIGQSSACVVPLRIGGGTRIKILQAMALGTPVVTTSKGAEGLEVTPETDILIADTPSTFAAQVLRVLDDFVLRARLATNGRRLVERLYTWDRIGSQFEDVLSEAQEASRGRAIAGPRPFGRRTNAASA